MIWINDLTTFFLHFQINCEEIETTEFAPHVSATCKAGVMNIKVAFNGSYTGTVHARDFRNSNCMVVGDGSSSVSLSLNMLAKQGQSDYCGILVSNVNAEVSEINLINKLLNLKIRNIKTMMCECSSHSQVLRDHHSFSSMAFTH